MDFLEHSVKDMGRSTKCLAVCLDLVKVFDTVEHQLLMETLNNHGIRGNALELMKNYTSNRIQRMKIGNEITDN